VIVNPSAPIESSVTTVANTNTKNKVREDALALANLLYDIFKEEETHANVSDELDEEQKDA
jgi:hypothetical protein